MRTTHSSVVDADDDDLELAAAREPHPHVWRGLALGVVLALVAWALLTAIGLTLYALF